MLGHDEGIMPEVVRLLQSTATPSYARFWWRSQRAGRKLMGKSDAGGPAAGETLLEQDDTIGASGAAWNGVWEMRRHAASG